MRILKSDFPGLADLLINALGLSSLSKEGDYLYFQFSDLLKKDSFDWTTLDRDTQTALINMGMLFSTQGIPYGESEDAKLLAKKIKAEHLLKSKNQKWKNNAIQQINKDLQSIDLQIDKLKKKEKAQEKTVSEDIKKSLAEAELLKKLLAAKKVAYLHMEQALKIDNSDNARAENIGMAKEEILQANTALEVYEKNLREPKKKMEIELKKLIQEKIKKAENEMDTALLSKPYTANTYNAINSAQNDIIKIIAFLAEKEKITAEHQLALRKKVDKEYQILNAIIRSAKVNNKDINAVIEHNILKVHEEIENAIAFRISPTPKKKTKVKTKPKVTPVKPNTGSTDAIPTNSNSMKKNTNTNSNPNFLQVPPRTRYSKAALTNLPKSSATQNPTFTPGNDANKHKKKQSNSSDLPGKVAQKAPLTINTKPEFNPPAGIAMPISPTGSPSTPPRRAG